MRAGLQLSDLVERRELPVFATELSKRYASLEGGILRAEKFGDIVAADALICVGSAGR